MTEPAVVSIDPKLLDHSPPGAQLAAALSRVQAKLHSVGKDRDVRVTPKDGGGSYTFRYATLAAIWDVIRGPCTENGLAIVQLPRVDVAKMMVVVETRVLHTSGESLGATVELPTKRTDPQGIGAVMSYARRYGLSAILGVTQDEENDEQALEDMRHHSPPPQSTQQPQARQRPTPTAPPKAAARAAPAPAGPPVSYAELEMQMESCASVAELTKVSAKAKEAGLSADDRGKLLAVYRTVAARLKGGAA